MTGMNGWHNYRTGQVDYHPEGASQHWDPKVFEDYLPRYEGMREGGPVIGLYRTYLAMGDHPQKAYEKALRAQIEAIESNR